MLNHRLAFVGRELQQRLGDALSEFRILGRLRGLHLVIENEISQGRIPSGMPPNLIERGIANRSKNVGSQMTRPMVLTKHVAKCVVDRVFAAADRVIAKAQVKSCCRYSQYRLSRSRSGDATCDSSLFDE